MFLTASNLFHYLCDVGLADTADIVDERFTISEIGRRNRNFRVMRRPDTSLFVKQVPLVITETTLSFLREAACAQLAIQQESMHALRAVMPHLMRYDADRHVLVYEVIEDAINLNEYIARNGQTDEILDALAATLAAIHAETLAPESLSSVASVLVGEAPWVFIIGEKAEQVMPNMSDGCREIVRQIRATPEILSGLAQLGAQWQALCLMHGDLKWDNIMVADLGDGEKALRVIDWELGNRGDPLWDVAGGLCAFFQSWLLNPSTIDPATNATSPAGAATLALTQYGSMRFWSLYRDAMPIVQGDVAFLRMAGLFGARLVLLAFELLARAPQMTPQAQNALHCARYCFSDPRRALADLLGIHQLADATAASPSTPSKTTPWKFTAPTRSAA